MENNKDSGNGSGDHISYCYSVGIIGDRMVDRMMGEIKAIEDRGGTRRDRGPIPVMYAPRCVNCGMLPETAEKIIAGGCLEEGEWACSDDCYDVFSEKGCPLEEDGHYRMRNKREGGGIK